MFVASTPAAVALRVLALRFNHGVDAVVPEGPHALAAFQQEALARIRAILAQRGGAVLADSVGLGKTHVAAALVAERVAARQPVLVCAPAALAGHWRRQLRRRGGWDWLSHTSLSRGSGRRRRYALIVLDEAHALRNPDTRRYRNLLTIAEGAELLLLTATPVNNSIRDFLHLLRLFARSDAFADIGVPDLAAAFEVAECGGDPAALRRIVEAVVVRRTRAFVERHVGGAVVVGGGRLAFPRQEPVRTVRYELARGWPELRAMLGETLRTLPFPAHEAAAQSPLPAELMRLGLLKRLESSSAAFRASIERQRRLTEQFRVAALDGYLLEPATHRGFYGTVDGAVQLPIRDVVLTPWPAHLDRSRFLARSDDALARLDLLARSVAGAGDAKLDALQHLLDHDLRDETVLIFTEFRDTAVALWRTLVRRGRAALIHGGGARLGTAPAARRTVVERFAPLANGVRVARPREQVRVLVATDVLAEGLNLQDARAVISYDLPWNPVRLAQRIGRIDRLGSPHATVLAFSFVPDRELDALLRLMRRVRRKIRAIRTVGGDAPRLERGPPPDGAPRLQHAPRSGAPPPRRAGALTLPGDSEDTETLRAAWRWRLAALASPGMPPAPATSAAIASRMPWQEQRRGALCAIDAGTGPPWLVLITDGSPAAVHPAAADRLLLDALDREASASPDPGWLGRAVRRALRAVRAVLSGSGTRSGGGRGAPYGSVRNRRLAPHARLVARAAAQVRRWLLESPGDAAAVARADAILGMLAGPLDTRQLLGVRDAVRMRTGPERMTGLERLAAAAGRVAPPAGEPAKASPRRPGRPAGRQRLRLIAALELIPVESERQNAASTGR